MASPGDTTSVAPNDSAHSRWRRCLATTTTLPARVSSFSASSVRIPTVPAPITSTSAFACTSARSAQWTAHASGSTSTARRSDMPSGTGWSCERWATNIRLHPPPVSAQNPVCRPGETCPVVTRSHRPNRPSVQDPHIGSTPRAAHDRTGSSVTRAPAARPSTSSRSSPTTSWPGTNGIDTSGEK